MSDEVANASGRTAVHGAGISIRRLARLVTSGQIGSTFSTNVILMVLGLVTGSLGAHLLGPTGRGQLAAVQLWAIAAASLGSGGILEAVTYFCSREPERGGTVVVTAMAMLAVLAIPITVCGIVTVPHLLAAEPDWVRREAQLFMLTVPVSFFLSPAVASLRGRGILRPWNLFRIAVPAGYAIILVLSMFLPFNRVITVAVGMLIYNALQLFFSGWVILHVLPRPLKVDLARLNPIGRYGVLSLSAAAPSWLNLRLDQLVMGAFIPPHQLGLYAVGATWSTAGGAFSNALSQIILPRLASVEGTEVQAGRLTMISRLAVVSGAATMACMLAATPIAVYVIFGSPYLPAVPATLVLVVAASFLGLNGFLEESLRGLGKPGLAAVAEAAGLVITVPTLYLLLPRLGILGAALASLMVYMSISAILVALLARHTGVRSSTLIRPRWADIAIFLGQLR